jgi:hypothetical protein
MARVLMLLLLCSLLIGAGCGGDDSDGDGDVSEREWAAKVNSICRENLDRIGELVSEVQAEGLART